MDDIRTPLPERPLKFLDQVRLSMRQQGLSLKTEKTYVYWIRFYIHYHGKRHPNELGVGDVEQFLTWLAQQRNVAVNTQRIALNALIFLYQRFLQIELGRLKFDFARHNRRAPVVFSHTEAMSVIENLENPYRLMAQLLYGAGLRLNECLRLRLKDLDFDRFQFCVRDGKGGKDRLLQK